MRRTRAILSGLILMWSMALAVPAPAQIMPNQGVPLPWFHSPAERAAREACRRNLPECRASTRAQLAFEESITVILPWAALAVAILGVLIWLRAKEKKREEHKRLARRHHTPGSFAKLDKEKKTKRGDDDEEADRMAF